ncbi:hypothetical protein [Nostoc sp.]|uniref:hypothetical protein n=1 Tax=Nostoc sp. TaxID=1180 RepID=UPI002FF9C0AE
MRPIKVRQNGDSCLLRWSYEGNTYSITWGKWTDAVDKAKMEYIARLIYQDSLSGNFDPTLHKYKAWLEGLVYTGNGNGSNGNSTPQPKQPPLLRLLEQRLIEHYSAADYSLLGNLKKFKKEIKTPAQQYLSQNKRMKREGRCSRVIVSHNDNSKTTISPCPISYHCYNACYRR